MWLDDARADAVALSASWDQALSSEAVATLFVSPADARQAAFDAGLRAFGGAWPTSLGPREWAWRGALDRKPGAHRLHIQWIPPPGSGDAPGCAAANETYRHEPPARCRQQACAAKFKVLAVSSC